MTRPRVHGQDEPFMAWLREQPDLDSVRQALTANDIDVVAHKYKTWVDGIGTREVNLMMDVEVKTRGGMPNKSQHETLFFRHQCLTSFEKRLEPLTMKRRSVWHFGMFVLSLDGIRPDDGARIRWCRFNEAGELIASEIGVKTLKNLFGFDIRPDTGRPLSLRRHHATNVFIEEEVMPLGFATDRVLVERS